MGRLFDTVSALAGVRQVVDYEAQAAIELEGRSRDVDGGERRYRFAMRGEDGAGTEGSAVFDAAPVLSAVISDLRAGVAVDVIGVRFHNAVADLIVEIAGRSGVHTVALSGGVFQNTVLLRLATDGLKAAGHHVITHRRVPPNDGGIALGQLMVGNSI
jgi:hydrogenase maturation protein HypF